MFVSSITCGCFLCFCSISHEVYHLILPSFTWRYTYTLYTYCVGTTDCIMSSQLCKLYNYETHRMNQIKLNWAEMIFDWSTFKTVCDITLRPSKMDAIAKINFFKWQKKIDFQPVILLNVNYIACLIFIQTFFYYI